VPNKLCEKTFNVIRTYGSLSFVCLHVLLKRNWHFNALFMAVAELSGQGSKVKEELMMTRRRSSNAWHWS